MGIIVFIITFFISWLLLAKYLNKKLGITKNKCVTETPGKHIYAWGRLIIIVIHFSILPFFEGKEDYVMNVYRVLFVILFWGLQAFLEWKYLRDSKQYIKTILFIVVCSIFIYHQDFFWNLTGVNN